MFTIISCAILSIFPYHRPCFQTRGLPVNLFMRSICPIMQQISSRSRYPPLLIACPTTRTSLSRLMSSRKTGLTGYSTRKRKSRPSISCHFHIYNTNLENRPVQSRTILMLCKHMHLMLLTQRAPFLEPLYPVQQIRLFQGPFLFDRERHRDPPT